MKAQRRTPGKPGLWTESETQSKAAIDPKRRTGNASSDPRSIARTFPSSSPGNAYKDRQCVLLMMGFQTYREYLDSKLWFEIKETVLLRDNRKCRLCDNVATQAHHMSYKIEVMKGNCLDLIISCCAQCHGAIERDIDGGKVSLAEANRRVGMLLRRNKKLKSKGRRKRRKMGRSPDWWVHVPDAVSRSKAKFNRREKNAINREIKRRDSGNDNKRPMRALSEKELLGNIEEINRQLAARQRPIPPNDYIRPANACR